MSTKQEMNAIKRAIALKLVDHPEHYVVKRSGNLNDSRLCYYQDGNTRAGRVLICAKYGGHTMPGIGVYFGPSIKKEHLPSLRALKFPDGFKLDEHSVKMRSKTGKTGWVLFGKEDCKNYREMYAQIVDPGSSLDAWKSLYDVLTNWLECTFGKLTLYEKETFTNRWP